MNGFAVSTYFDVIIIGAGASGLMCAGEAGKRGRKVLVIDHAKQPGLKLLMTGGGRCNFTNLEIDAGHYVSHNPHFCKSALRRFSQWDFIEQVKNHGIGFSERDHGQLFCDRSARDILDMLLAECAKAGVAFQLDTSVDDIQRLGGHRFQLSSNRGLFPCDSLVIATGGLTIPSSGASPFGYRVAEKFGIDIRPPRAGLVPLTFHFQDKQKFAPLTGIAVPAAVTCGRHHFRENLLFTHRGLSGPVILQISLYWRPGDILTIDLLPGIDLAKEMKAPKSHSASRKVKTILTDYLPKRLVEVMVTPDLAKKSLREISSEQLRQIAAQFQNWSIKPNGTEGYRTAEVTLGGVDCDAISSQTMECRTVPGLYFIGEVLDVTGWLGGYNLQWAWSSGWCAGQSA
jgi:predicted Rossmann fold flavoprotein